MAQTGFTPISIYYSATTTNVPTSGNLVAGELAINTADGKLFYKDSSGVVQVLATKGGVGTSSTTQILYNSSGLTVGSANLTFDGQNLTQGNGTYQTILKLNGSSSGTAGGTAIYFQNTGTSNFAIGNYSSIIGGAYNTDAIYYLSSANNHLFYSSGSEKVRIDSSGNLLVGSTTLPASNRTKGFAAKSNATGGIQVYQVASNSDWAINATSGSICNFYSDNGTALVYSGSISVNGNVTTYGSISDYRLKENIEPITKALDKVLQLNPVTYTFKDGGQKSEGFIAHELQAIIPEAVTGEKDAVKEDGTPEYQGVDSSFLIATLTAAIQEQQALIESLTTRLTALESK
jgi:hypothetical protein